MARTQRRRREAKLRYGANIPIKHPTSTRPVQQPKTEENKKSKKNKK